MFQGWLPAGLDRAAAALLWVWFVNLYNFMDGIDGIAGSETAAIGIGLALFAIAGIGNDPALAAPAAIIAAAAIGFLVWNWAPARIFLGDVGSVPLGYLLGFCCSPPLRADTGSSRGAALIRGLQGNDLPRTTRWPRPRSTSSATAAPSGARPTPRRVPDRPRRDRRQRRGHARRLPAAVSVGDRRRRPDRHGVLLQHARRQGPRRQAPADRRPQGPARLHGLRRLGLGRRRRGRPGRLRRVRRPVHRRRDRHGHGPVGRRRVPRRDASAAWRTGGSRTTGSTTPSVASSG